VLRFMRVSLYFHISSTASATLLRSVRYYTSSPASRSHHTHNLLCVLSTPRCGLWHDPLMQRTA
jgi:hypothetical protein